MLRLLLCGAILLWPMAQVRAGEPKAKLELKVDGKLAPDDLPDKVRKNPHKVHDIKMKADTFYGIHLSSKDFDTFLRLEDSEGKNLADDDDGGGGLNSLITFKAPKDGDYRIIVTSFMGGTGSYTVKVRKGASQAEVSFDPFEDLIGKQAPEVLGEFSLNGEVRKLSDLKGKVVLLDFWAVWCGPCIATFPHLREWHKDFKKDGLEILGVTTYFEVLNFDKDKGSVVKAENKLTAAEEHGMLKSFSAHHKLEHTLLTLSRDNWMKTGQAYGVTGIPHVALIDRKGAIRMVRVGNSPANARALHEEIKKLVAEK